MAKSFVVKACFGLGVTSVLDFVNTASRYKAVQDVGIDYITAATFSLPKKKGILVFDSLLSFIRFSESLKPSQIAVVSDTPVLLKDIQGFVPLDYSNERSFEFNFKEIDMQLVLRTIKSSKASVVCRLVSRDNLGYHIARIKNSGELLNSYLALTSSMPHDKRSQLREAMVNFFSAKKPDIKGILSSIDQISKSFTFSSDLEAFKSQLGAKYTSYHEAVNSKDIPAAVAKKYDIDQYAVSYFRRLFSQKAVNEERVRKNNVQVVKSTNA